MNKRDWESDYRSWILYKNKKTEKDNVLFDEVDGNVFMFDCETARLSVWSEQRGILVNVGISRILAMEAEGRTQKSDLQIKGIRVFYKGIFLDECFVENDVGLLEKIDIKSELNRSHINISRHGFTEEGRRFFDEELCPKILEAVWKVLRYLGKTILLQEGDTFQINEKIAGIIREKCDIICSSSMHPDKDRLKRIYITKNELISIIINATILSFYAQRDEWQLIEKIDGGIARQNKNLWNDLIDEIEGILSTKKYQKIVADLGEMTNFFNIKAYNENGQPLLDSIKPVKLRNRVFFPEIFNIKKHWAVIQIRKDSYSAWKSFLMLLDSPSEGAIDYYAKITDFPISAQNNTILERWGCRLCNFDSNLEKDYDSSQRFLIKWILKNVPTVGMFSDATGNVRVSILATRIYPAIYLGKNFKCLILKRIVEEAKNKPIQRFSTIVWQNQEVLSCPTLPYNMYFVKRGYLSAYSYHKCIIPFDSDVINLLADAVDTRGDFESKIIDIFGAMDMFRYICIEDVHLQQIIMEELANVIHIEFERKKEQTYPNIGTLVDSISETTINQWKEIYNALEDSNGRLIERESLKEFKEQQSKRKEYIQNNEGFETLCNIWHYCLYEADKIYDHIDTCRKKFETDVKEDTVYLMKRNRLLDFLVLNLTHRVDRVSAERYVARFEVELLDLFHAMEIQNVARHIADMRSRYYIFCNQLDNNMKKTEDEKNGT